MNDCIRLVRIEYIYHWGFQPTANKSSYATAMVANNELYGQIIDNLELLINELEL
jgi:hypothetical protein